MPPVNKAHFPWLLFTSQRADQLIELIILRVLLWPSPSLVKGPKGDGEISRNHRLSWKKMDSVTQITLTQLTGCVSQWVSVCMCVCVCVFACFLLLLILWIRSSLFWRGEWVDFTCCGRHQGTDQEPSVLFFENLFFGKTLKDALWQWEHLNLGICALACDWFWNFGALGKSNKSFLCVYLSVGNLKFYVCLNWIIICNFQCFFPLFAINYTQWKIRIFTFFEWAVHWNSHLQYHVIITTHYYLLTFIVPNRNSVHY